VLGNIPEMGLTETTTAIQAAAKAFVGWSKTTAKVWHLPRISIQVKLNQMSLATP
jgi:hypothetical protein